MFFFFLPKTESTSKVQFRLSLIQMQEQNKCVCVCVWLVGDICHTSSFSETNHMASTGMYTMGCYTCFCFVLFCYFVFFFTLFYQKKLIEILKKIYFASVQVKTGSDIKFPTNNIKTSNTDRSITTCRQSI